MHGLIISVKMVPDIVHLGMAVVAAGDAVVGAGCRDLVELDLAVGPPLLREARLEEAAATTSPAYPPAVPATSPSKSSPCSRRAARASRKTSMPLNRIRLDKQRNRTGPASLWDRPIAAPAWSSSP